MNRLSSADDPLREYTLEHRERFQSAAREMSGPNRVVTTLVTDGAPRLFSIWTAHEVMRMLPKEVHKVFMSATPPAGAFVAVAVCSPDGVRGVATATWLPIAEPSADLPDVVAACFGSPGMTPLDQ